MTRSSTASSKASARSNEIFENERKKHKLKDGMPVQLHYGDLYLVDEGSIKVCEFRFVKRKGLPPSLSPILARCN